jgi:glycosyltransferase involved in cell wall biosynthesis
MKKIKVSACIITYNHEKYIKECLDGALRQNLNCDYEINVFEDLSTDNTRSIVLDYAKRYPDKIKVFLNEKNLGLIGNWVYALTSCNGDYIAICEGDDYWMNDNKIQKQVDFLENHPDFALASHNANIIIDRKIIKSYCRQNHPRIMDLEHILTYGSGVPTCSLLIKKDAISNLPDWFRKMRACDWTIQVIAAQSGKMIYFNEIMSTYRRHNQGALFALKKEAKSRGGSDFCLPSKYTIEMIEAMDEYFEFKYSKQLQIQKTYWYNLYVTGYLEVGDIKTAKKYFYKIIRSSFSLKYWKYPLIPMNRFLKLFVLILPISLIKKILKSEETNF